MNSKYALALAVVLGVVAAFAVQDYIGKERQKMLEKVRPVQVVFSKEDIPAGTQLRENVLESKDWPQAYVTDQLVLWSQWEDKLKGKVASQRISAGKPIFLDDVDVKQPPSPATGLQIGRRAFTISTDLITGVAGMVRPGSHVDILAHFKDLQSQGGSRRGQPAPTTQVASTVTLLEDVPVLAVGAYGGRHWGPRGGEGTDASSVTVSVTPLQASLLAFAQKQGGLVLALRRDGDAQDAQPEVVDSNNLFQTVQKARESAR